LAVRDLAIDERLELTTPGVGSFSTDVVGGGQGLYLAYVEGAGKSGVTRVRVDL
jgi:outer membrane lipoprotein SlyB